MKDAFKIELARGPYDGPRGKASVWPARTFFLSCVRSLVPRVLEELRDEPLLRYVDAGCPYTEPPTLGERVPMAKTFEDLIASRELGLRGLGTSLFEWGQRWNLLSKNGNREWCLNYALGTLRDWVMYEPMHGLDWGVIALSHDIRVPIPVLPPKGLPGWDFIVETRRDYVKRIRALAEAEFEKNEILSNYDRPSAKKFIHSSALSAPVDQYCDDVERYLRSQGWLLVKGRRLPELEKHIVWTARAQVKGDTCTKIAEDENVDVPTVTRAVKKTLDLLDLRSRADIKPGRRPNSVESPDSRRRATRRAGLSN